MSKKASKKITTRKIRRNLKVWADIKHVGMKKFAKLGYGVGLSRSTFKKGEDHEGS